MRGSTSPIRLAVLGCLAWLTACTDPYLPEAITSPPSFLVVDGFLNARGVTTIRLSRTYAIGAATAPPAETRATAYLEEEAGPRHQLREAPAGTYTSGPLALNPAKRYRLHLTTLAGQEYASDFVPAKITPPIDEVRWRADNTGLGIYVRAHDDANATRYYRWETDETWEINPVYRPSVEYVNKAIRDIVVPYPTVCWGNGRSTAVQIDKTTALSQDVVSNYRVRLLPPTSERLNSRYSILVQQHALTKEEYGYWELLRKNTESIGTLFDPQPVQLTGNVHNLSKAADVALGFVGAHSLTEKRVFVRRDELPRAWAVTTGYEDCLPADSVFLFKPPPPPYPPIAVTLAASFSGGAFLPINPILDGVSVIGYSAKSRECIDCRLRGSAVKPSFWP